jgi:hypothetical protein
MAPILESRGAINLSSLVSNASGLEVLTALIPKSPALTILKFIASDIVGYSMKSKFILTIKKIFCLKTSGELLPK